MDRVEIGQVRQIKGGRSHRVGLWIEDEYGGFGWSRCGQLLSEVDRPRKGKPTCKNCLRKEKQDG
jgi:hypothetical protein